ncbi:sigma-70 family RNA polymerase sigma factor [Nitrogeniibacter mangrovi]|uniref:sigma-70 family RNA polymerase sigma factor n=1 Tax=Nitrogeniibacter mangrovi TaxID=2016596 RepID=UPI001E6224C5|nr:sigma-70 family RNA polymerase sigma factor [Nitrogeniibacter mangrovi]
MPASESPADRVTPEALEALRTDMLRFATLQLRDEHLAEDLVQDTMITALSKAGQFAGRSTVKTWVFTILRNNIIDAIHKRSRTINASDYAAEGESLDAAFDKLFKENAHWSPASRPTDWGRPEEAMEEQQFWAVFDACMEHLPENTARVFMMREVLELSSQEICDTLAITMSNCHVILHRARNALRRCLEGNWFADGEACPSC